MGRSPHRAPGTWRELYRDNRMKSRRSCDCHHDDLEDSCSRKGGKGARGTTGEVARGQDRGRTPGGCDGGAELVCEEPCRDGKVEEKKRSWRRPPCVPQPRSEDTDVKEKPLAAMRMVLQKRRGSNPGAAALRQVPQHPEEAGAKGPNMAAAPKRSWASVVRGTDQDQRTSLKSPPEEKDVREKSSSREEKR